MKPVGNPGEIGATEEEIVASYDDGGVDVVVWTWTGEEWEPAAPVYRPATPNPPTDPGTEMPPNSSPYLSVTWSPISIGGTFLAPLIGPFAGGVHGELNIGLTIDNAGNVSLNINWSITPLTGAGGALISGLGTNVTISDTPATRPYTPIDPVSAWTSPTPSLPIHVEGGYVNGGGGSGSFVVDLANPGNASAGMPALLPSSISTRLSLGGGLWAAVGTPILGGNYNSTPLFSVRPNQPVTPASPPNPVP